MRVRGKVSLKRDIRSAPGKMSVQVLNYASAVASPTFENHVVGLFSADILRRFITVNPPTDRVERRKPNCPFENITVEPQWHVNRLELIIAKVGVKETRAKLVRRRAVCNAPRTKCFYILP